MREVKTVCGMLNTITQGKSEKTICIMTYNRCFVVTRHDVSVDEGFIKGKADTGEYFVIPFDKIEYITA